MFLTIPGGAGFRPSTVLYANLQFCFQNVWIMRIYDFVQITQVNVWT